MRAISGNGERTTIRRFNGRKELKRQVESVKIISGRKKEKYKRRKPNGSGIHLLLYGIL